MANKLEGAPHHGSAHNLYEIAGYKDTMESLQSAIRSEVEATRILPINHNLETDSTSAAAARIPNEWKSAAPIWEELARVKVDLSKRLEAQPVVLEILCSGHSSPLAALGDFSLIIGKAKSRKTFFVSLLVAALVSNTADGSNERLGHLRASMQPGRQRVLVFDTEQAEYDVQKVARRILNTAQVPASPWLDVFCLRTFDTAQRLALIEYAIYNTEGVAVVIIDGIRDLIHDINSPEEATMIATKLLKWTEERGVHIVTVLHQNKGDNNARGHVGAELTNKAYAVLAIAKDSNNPELSIVTPEYTRGRDFQPFAFGIDDNGLPFIAADWKAAEGKAAREKVNPNNLPESFHKERIREVYAGLQAPTYSDLWRALKVAVLPYYPKFGDNAAKEFVSYYQSNNWITKDTTTRYPIYRSALPV